MYCREMGSKCYPPLVSMEVASAPSTVETLSVAKVCTSESPTGAQQSRNEASFTRDSSPSLSGTTALTDKSECDSKDTLIEEGTAAAVYLDDFVSPTSVVKLGDEIAKTRLDYFDQLNPITSETGSDTDHAYWPTAVADNIPREGLEDELPATHDAGSVEEKVEEVVFEGAEANDDVLEASARAQDEPTKGE